MISWKMILKNSKIENATSFEELKRILAEEEIQFSSEATYTKDGKDIAPKGAIEGKLWKPEYIDLVEDKMRQVLKQDFNKIRNPMYEFRIAIHNVFRKYTRTGGLRNKAIALWMEDDEFVEKEKQVKLLHKKWHDSLFRKPDGRMAPYRDGENR